MLTCTRETHDAEHDEHKSHTTRSSYHTQQNTWHCIRYEENTLHSTTRSLASKRSAHWLQHQLYQ